ncbi:MAG: PA14 domain-containing protein [Porticoccaceae bacterium]|nr:PA14 domain-containing protein [Porticoccaceae bacterium]
MDRDTKIYSIIAKQDFEKESDNIIDTVLKNLIANLNNSNPSSRFKSPVQIVGDLMFTERYQLYPVEGDLPKKQVDGMVKGSDGLVSACSQLLGQVLTIDGSTFIEANHLGAQNIGFNLQGFLKLLISKDVEGFAMISSDIQACNKKSTVTARSDCLNEKFVQILLMLIADLIRDNLVQIKHYLGTFVELPNFNGMQAVSEHIGSKISISNRPSDVNFATTFDFQINIKEPGDYTFYLRSDDGSKLYIDGVAVIDNDGLHSVRERSETTSLLAGKHKVRVEYFQREGGLVIQAAYQGPDTLGVKLELRPLGTGGLALLLLEVLSGVLDGSFGTALDPDTGEKKYVLNKYIAILTLILQEP